MYFLIYPVFVCHIIWKEILVAGNEKKILKDFKILSQEIIGRLKEMDKK